MHAFAYIVALDPAFATLMRLRVGVFCNSFIVATHDTEGSLALYPPGNHYLLVIPAISSLTWSRS